MEKLGQSLLWLVQMMYFFPKTLFRFLLLPWHAHTYVLQELAKPTHQRFSNYSSPISFYIVGVVGIPVVIELITGTRTITRVDELPNVFFEVPLFLQLLIGLTLHIHGHPCPD